MTSRMIGRPARKHDDLKRTRLFREKGSEPIHPIYVALNKLIVEHDHRSQVLREAQAV
jgi:hypothetical protein